VTIPDRSVWRTEVATWTIARRQAWADRAEAYQAAGEPWNVAEWQSFREGTGEPIVIATSRRVTEEESHLFGICPDHDQDLPLKFISGGGGWLEYQCLTCGVIVTCDVDRRTDSVGPLLPVFNEDGSPRRKPLAAG
jgi:hypothetical protein